MRCFRSVAMHAHWIVSAALSCVACGSDGEGSAGVASTNAVVESPRAPGSANANANANASANGSSDAGTAVEAGPGPTPPTEYAAEKAWAESHGVVIDPTNATVVAKRHGNDARSETYEDMFVVFRPDGTLVRFIGTTKPAQMPNPSSGVVPDIDHDGRKDLGIVRPGVYRAHGSVTFGLPGYERPAFTVKTESGDSNLPAWRDLSGDGDFSATEKTTSEQRDYNISGVYIHYGFEVNGTKLGPDEYVGPWSVGCPNIKYASSTPSSKPSAARARASASPSSTCRSESVPFRHPVLGRLLRPPIAAVLLSRRERDLGRPEVFVRNLTK